MAMRYKAAYPRTMLCIKAAARCHKSITGIIKDTGISFIVSHFQDAPTGRRATFDHGAATEVDLDSQLEYYIRSKSPDSWGLTKNYSYWTLKMNSSKEHSIESSLEGWKCEGGQNSSSSHLEPSVCRDQFIWNLSNSIRSPFPLSVTLNVTVIHNGTLKKALVLIDLTNRTSIIWEPQGMNLTSPTKEILQESCNFSATATFQGRFAYHIRPRGDHHGYYSEGVENLHNSSVGLYNNTDKLHYDMNGTYSHFVICES
ncbi:hypothetical protein V5799_026918 [Amblyomma americanum]|uniref:Uncharacterized protein n=1 Tax=Amblyomma americanum TaxID=6943 RepID=A0AAQ4DH75_AMBAM